MPANHGENKRCHLTMIQGVVNRLAQNSFAIKGWSVVLVSALFALAASSKLPALALVGLFPALVLWVLDGYFLWQERLFRGLYTDVSAKSEDQIDFSMNTSPYRQDVGSWRQAAFYTKAPRNTLFLFHGTIVLLIVAIAAALITLERRGTSDWQEERSTASTTSRITGELRRSEKSERSKATSPQQTTSGKRSQEDQTKTKR